MILAQAVASLLAAASPAVHPSIQLVAQVAQAVPPRGPRERRVIIDGQAVAFPAAARSDAARLPIALLVSGELKVVLATLLHRGWSLNLHAPAAHEPFFTLGGRPGTLELEHGGARIDERYLLELWRLPASRRELPLWAVAAARQGGLRPLQAPSQPPVHSPEARDRALADFSFGLSQTRQVAPPEGTLPRVAWVELVGAPEGAEEVAPDDSAEPGAGHAVIEAMLRTALDGFVSPQLEPRTPLSRGPVRPAEPQTPAHLAIAESVQAAVAGLVRLAPLPPSEPVAAVAINRPEHAGKRLALTFDACSTLDRSFYDERVTKVLRDTATPATLFISGRWAETHQELVRELGESPLFEIANHSYVHPHMTEMPPERQEHELLWTQQILLTLTGKLPRFFRPPYGEMNDALVAEAARLGLRTVEYDFPSGDPDKHATREKLVEWVLRKARPGSIVVMHMNRHGWHTAEALPAIIAGLRARGYELTRVGDLVDADAAAAGTAPEADGQR